MSICTGSLKLAVVHFCAPSIVVIAMQHLEWWQMQDISGIQNSMGTNNFGCTQDCRQHLGVPIVCKCAMVSEIALVPLAQRNRHSVNLQAHPALRVQV